MRVAVICLAYLGNPSGASLLSKYFSHLDAHLFLHVDAKVSAAPYECLNGAPNVTQLPDRHEIFWGGFNTVQAAVSAIEFAQTMTDFDMFIFTTEDSVPLLSPAEMDSRLSMDIDWIAIHAPNPPWVWERYERFFFFDSRATSFRYFEAGERFITEQDLRRLDRMRRRMAEGKIQLPELYHGSGWWALSRETIHTILERYHADGGLRESFEFSAIPEEQYFHTIIGLSNIKRTNKYFMYVDWERDPTVKPYVFSQLSELQIVRDENPELLFVRKIDLQSEEVEVFVDELLR